MIGQNMQAYRVFYEVAKAGNITHAAQHLYISQPAVSSAISNLESSLGTRLFVRKSRGVELTKDGKVLYEYVKSAFEILSAGENELMKLQKMQVERLIIGSSMIMCHYVLRSFIKNFVEAHPYIEISFINQSSHKTFSMLEDAQVHIGITTEPPMQAMLEYYPFIQYDFTFVATPAYLNNLSLRGAENMLDYMSLGTLMLLPQDHPKRRRVDHFMQKNAIEAGHILEVSNMDLLISFTEMSMGIGYVIRHFVANQLEQGTLTELPLLTPQENHYFSLVYNKTIPISKAMQTFIEYFRQMYPPI